MLIRFRDLDHVVCYQSRVGPLKCRLLPLLPLVRANRLVSLRSLRPQSPTCLEGPKWDGVQTWKSSSRGRRQNKAA